MVPTDKEHQSSEQNCPKCRAPMENVRVDQPCPACLMELGLQDWNSRTGNGLGAAATSPSDSPFEPPTLEALSDQFAQ